MKENILGYWEKAANRLYWFKPWYDVLDAEPPIYRWFRGGECNITFNALDIHIDSPRRNKVALIWEGDNGESRRFTYYDLYREVNRFANTLKSLGVKQGDRVVIYLPNLPETVVSLLAVARIGAIHVPVDTRLGPHFLKKIVNETDSKIIIGADGYYRKGNAIGLIDAVNAALSACPQVNTIIMIHRIGEEVALRETTFWYHELIEGQPSAAEAMPIEASSPLGILFTCNHEGECIGIVSAHGGYMVGIHETTKEIFHLTDADVIWWNVELSSIIGQSYAVYGPLLAGTTILLYEGHPLYPGPERVWSIIDKYGVSIFGTYPSRLRSLMPFGERPIKQWDLSTLRLLCLSGEAVDEPLINWLYSNVALGGNIINLWIEAETGAFVLASKEEKAGAWRSKPPSSYFYPTLPIFEVDVVDKGGKTLPSEHSGILIIKEPFPSIISGVWKKEAFYLKYWAPKTHIFLSKDLAERGKDGGIKILKHRSERTINIGSLSVAAGEIERAFLQHSAVMKAAVRAVPDKVKGQVVEVRILLNKNAERTYELRKALLNYAHTELGPAVIIRQIEFSDNL